MRHGGSNDVRAVYLVSVSVWLGLVKPFSCQVLQFLLILLSFLQISAWRREKEHVRTETDVFQQNFIIVVVSSVEQLQYSYLNSMRLGLLSHALQPVWGCYCKLNTYQDNHKTTIYSDNKALTLSEHRCPLLVHQLVYNWNWMHLNWIKANQKLFNFHGIVFPALQCAAL